MKLFCNACGQHTNHQVIKSFRRRYTPDDAPDMQIDYAEGTWQIIECSGCELVSFRELWHTSEDWDPNEGPTSHETRYPRAGKDQLPVRYFEFRTPPNIHRIYRESIEAFNIEAFTLCAAGLRAVIEGICAEEGVRSGKVEKKTNGKTAIATLKNLEGKIEGLHQKEILSKRHAEILHALRFIGNDAVHQLDVPPKEDLKRAIEIVEHTLENLYALSNLGRGLLVKRTKKTKKPIF